MKIVSKLFDERIDALNALIEMPIDEYSEIAKYITSKNSFQRKRVKGSSMVYKLLREDLKKGCLIPPIVLAVKKENLSDFSDMRKVEDSQIESLINSKELIILDGLQRTYTILEVVRQLKDSKDPEDTETLTQVKKYNIRIEVYLGLNKIGILYRMLTLNTGQTPMSIRHQIEILYSDYLTNELDEIRFLREIDSQNPQKIGEYKFRDVIEGFNSYLNRDELGLKRSDILENIENLQTLAKENKNEDIFREYITTHFNFLNKMEELSSSWSITREEAKAQGAFGRNILEIFAKPQMLSGFGAAIGKLKQFKLIENFQDIKNSIKEVKFQDNNYERGIFLLLEKLQKIKNSAKNIGSSQRLFMTYFFRELFNKESDSYLIIDDALTNGYNKYLSQL